MSKDFKAPQILKFSNQTNIVPNPTVPLILSKDKSVPWVKFGSDNMYPSFIIELFNKSSTNKTCLLAKQLGVFGEGLECIDPAYNFVLNEANPYETWNDVFEKIVCDYVIHGGFAVDIVWNATGDRISKFRHVPFENIRAQKWNIVKDRVDKYYYSDDWLAYRKYRPIEKQAFDPELSLEFPEQILYFFDYTPGNPYYPLPRYSGSLQDIQIDIEVSNLHLSNLANGLMPGMWINFNEGKPDPLAIQAIYADIASSFSGTQNAGKFFCTFSDSKDSAPEVTPISSTNDDYYIALQSRTISNILSGHGVTSPLLVGLYEGGNGLTSNKDEILVAYEHFKTTILEPDIKSLLKPMNMLMKYFGYPEVKLQVAPLKLFGGMDTTDTLPEDPNKSIK